ncbi:MAG TPA: hypothetical protein PL135_10150 [Spirochaetota bacterium]|nr:MAG: hypothetical protein BWY96_02183 [Spirochaetes bacterium ADurb.BinA120]HPI14968.1 hypothetical protein [Spirochaetota bacterium]
MNTMTISADAVLEYNDNLKNYPRVGDIVSPIGCHENYRVVETHYDDNNHNITIESL